MARSSIISQVRERSKFAFTVRHRSGLIGSKHSTAFSFAASAMLPTRSCSISKHLADFISTMWIFRSGRIWQGTSSRSVMIWICCTSQSVTTMHHGPQIVSDSDGSTQGDLRHFGRRISASLPLSRPLFKKPWSGCIPRIGRNDGCLPLALTGNVHAFPPHLSMCSVTAFSRYGFLLTRDILALIDLRNVGKP